MNLQGNEVTSIFETITFNNKNDAVTALKNSPEGKKTEQQHEPGAERQNSAVCSK